MNMVFKTYVYDHSLNMHGQQSSEARCLLFLV